MTLLTIGEIIEGEILTIAFGGEGILRYRGFVVFVPFTAIGDQISCRIVDVKSSFAKGEIISIEKTSHHRATPPCPYFGVCGGCQLQHLTEQAQLNYKLEAVTDALKRIGHLELPPLSIVPANKAWAYRRHITLHLRPHKGGFQAGYIGQDNRSLIAIETCPIFNEPDQSIIKEVQHVVTALPNPSQQEGRVTLLKNQRDQFILSFLFKEKYPIDRKAFQSVLQHVPTLSGILVHTPDQQIILGDPFCEEKFEGLTFRFSPQTFIQNHPEQSANIYKHICEIAHRTPQRLILDLYCGFGMTTLLLAQQGCLVEGMESNREAVKFAQENAAFNHLKQARFLAGDVEKLLPTWFKKEHHPTLVVMNPPRQGLSKRVVEILLKFLPNELIYVSCMPSTLARDLSLLCKQHYQVAEGQVFDMFPQTAHVETLIYLKKKI